MSSDLNFSVNDLTDSESFVKKVGESFYPNNQAVYTRTTESTEDLAGKTLTSADPVKILQGDGIYRNPAFAISGYKDNVKSAMHGILAAQADIDDSVEIQDPSNPDKKLHGQDARREIAKNSLLSTGYAPGGMFGTMKDLVNSKYATDANSSSNSEVADGSASVSNGNGLTLGHSTKGYTYYSEGGVFNRRLKSNSIGVRINSSRKSYI